MRKIKTFVFWLFLLAGILYFCNSVYHFSLIPEEYVSYVLIGSGLFLFVTCVLAFIIKAILLKVILLILAFGFFFSGCYVEHLNEQVKGIFSYQEHADLANVEVIDVKREENHNALTVFIAGSDTRGSELEYYGRTDVDIIASINPDTRQILVIGLPRDLYVENPALDNRLDKLTHLGNNGIDNTISELESMFDTDIDGYIGINFATFKDIVDALGGVTVNNPYAFSTKYFDYPEGEITMHGIQALDYVRERHVLEKGDFDRNEHQLIMLQSIISTFKEKISLSQINDMLKAMEGKFITDLPAERILGSVQNFLLPGKSWDIILYHLGGEGTFDTTASMGNMQLYVVKPFESQIIFLQEQLSEIKNNDLLVQQTIPDDDKTTFIEN